MTREALKLALEEYLCREMPAGTVIGDPKWWAAKIANVMTGKAVAEAYKQGYDHGVERQEAIQRLSEIEKQTPASKNQWWAKELEGFWGDSDYQVTLDTRRAAKTALNVIFDHPQPKQEQGEPVVCGCCNGSGRMVRDPDIGTDQDCFACEGSGVFKDTTPQQRTWVGLTLEDKEEYVSQDFGGNRLNAMDWAEKRLKEKNNGC